MPLVISSGSPAPDPGGKSDVDDPSDDEDDDDLPEVDVADPAHAIQRRGRDIELSGPLLPVSIMAPGFSEAAEQEARARGIDVEVSSA